MYVINLVLRFFQGWRNVTKRSVTRTISHFALFSSHFLPWERVRRTNQFMKKQVFFPFVFLYRPGTKRAISEKTLRRISRAIGDNPKLVDLGLELDFATSQINLYLADNRSGAGVTFDGTWNMLCAWREKTSKEDQIPKLRAALEEVGLNFISEQHLSEND